MINNDKKTFSDVQKDNAEYKDLQASADAAVAEENTAAAELGKFGSVSALLAAYRNLEAEFTRRSQRLKELEKGNKAAPASDGTKATPSRSSEEELIETALSNEKVREAVIGEYLKGIASAKEVPLISGGGAIPAPRNYPKSVKEAGILARKFLNK